MEQLQYICIDKVVPLFQKLKSWRGGCGLSSAGISHKAKKKKKKITEGSQQNAFETVSLSDLKATVKSATTVAKLKYHQITQLWFAVMSWAARSF